MTDQTTPQPHASDDTLQAVRGAVNAQDVRLDKLAVYALGVVVTIVISVGGAWLNGIKADIADLKKAVVDLSTTAVRKEADRKDIDDLARKVDKFEGRLLDLERLKPR